jgi:2-polyprenyl-6-methoxyphenol hydroxylase-like FAD-dependent oxidoreductase
MTESNGSAIVVGGGLGGLSVASALAQRGWTVNLFEQADEMRAYGAGIWLWANGLRALKSIGAYDAVMAADGLHASAWEIRDGGNRIVRRREAPPSDPLYVPRRADLYQSLIDVAAKAGVNITCSAQVGSATEEGTVVFADGTSLTADLVVASDGVRSRVRESLGLTKECRGTGIGITRLLVPTLNGERPGDIIIENWNRKRGLMINPCTPDETYLAFGGPVTDVVARENPVNVEMYKQAFPHHARIVESAEGVEGHWDEVMIARLHAWSAGRVAIIGDAAHGLPPTLGQAANLAFGNAVVLANFVSKVPTDQVARALQDWEREMRPLTDHTQKWSEFYNKVGIFWPDKAEWAKMTAIKYALRLPRVERNLNRAARNTIPF